MADNGNHVSIRIEEQPLTLEMAARTDEPQIRQKQPPCIFRVHPKYREGNEGAYSPSTVTIGPYHQLHESAAKNGFIITEDNKIDYCKDFLGRTTVTYTQFLSLVREQESKIRHSYAEDIPCDSNSFTEKMLRDSFFVIEYFLKQFERVVEKKSCTTSKTWDDEDIIKNLIMFENQAPFFLLDVIYSRAGIKNNLSFLELTLFYFQGFNVENLEPKDVKPHHLTDLVRFFLLPNWLRCDPEDMKKSKVEGVRSASKLAKAGLVFNASQRKSLLDVNFEDGKLTMAKFEIDDVTDIHIRNVIALEQRTCRGRAYVTEFIFMLSFLIETEDDAKFLKERGIIESLALSPGEIAKMVSSLGRQIPVHEVNSRYGSIFENLNAFVEKAEQKAKHKRKFCDTPIKIVGAIMGVVTSLFGVYELARNVVFPTK